MNNWFECKVKYKKIDEQGNEKDAKEVYLIDAVSFTEAEARIHKVLEQYISGEFNVTNINRSTLSEIVAAEDGEYWFKAKVSISTIDEKSGKEKASNQLILIAADNLKQSIERLETSLSEMIVPWDLKMVQESPIIDVFPFFEEENTEQEIPDNLKPLADKEGDINNEEFETEGSDDIEPLETPEFE